MKHLLFLAFGVMGSLAMAVAPFDLPWANHAETGKLYRSTDYRKAVFVIETYFRKCPYCKKNAGNVNALAEKYSTESRVQVLDVGVDRKDSDYEDWIAEHKPNHPVLKDPNRVLVSQLGTTAYPSTYVVDCKGTVLAKTLGVWGPEEEQILEEAIKEGLNTSCR